MYECNLFVIILVCVVGGFLLQHFDNDGNPYGWLISLTIGGMVSTLMMLLPSAQKGSPLALISGYLLIGLLILSSLILFGLSRLPSKLVPFNSPDFEKTGGVVFSLLSAGLSVLLKNVLSFIVTFSGVILKMFSVILKMLFSLMVLLMTVLDGAPRHRPYLLGPQISP